MWRLEQARPAGDATDVVETEWRLFAEMPLPSWAFELESLRLLAVNRAAIARFGWDPEELAGMTASDLWPPAERERFRTEIRRQGASFPSSSLWTQRTKSGELFEAKIVARVLDRGPDRSPVVLAVDVTEVARAEAAAMRAHDQRVLAERVEAVGRLAGGIGRDFDALLGAVLASCAAASMTLPEDAAARGPLEEIARSARQGSTLARQLLAYARNPSARSHEGAASRSKGAARSAAGVQPRTRATLLVAEDDRTLRELALELLEREGYRVLVADSVHRALELANDPGGVDLLVTDIGKSSFGGPELAKVIRARRPDLPAVFVTGSVLGLRRDAPPTGEHDFVLEQPFAAKELLDRVREALGSR